MPRCRKFHFEGKASSFHIFIHQQSVLPGTIHHLLLFLMVLSLKRVMFVRRRNGVILPFFLAFSAFSCILISSAVFNNKRRNEADHKRKIGTSCMFHVNIYADLKSRTGLMQSLHTFRPGSCKLNRTGLSRTGQSSYRSHVIRAFSLTESGLSLSGHFVSCCAPLTKRRKDGLYF